MRWARLVPVAGLLVSCGGKSDRPAAAADTLTARERQERIQAMPIPGARGVGRALEAQDSATARARLVDSVARQP